MKVRFAERIKLNSSYISIAVGGVILADLGVEGDPNRTVVVGPCATAGPVAVGHYANAAQHSPSF